MDVGNEDEVACRELMSYLKTLLTKKQLEPLGKLPSGVVEEAKALLDGMNESESAELSDLLKTRPLLEYCPNIRCSRCNHLLKPRDLAFMNEARSYVLCGKCYNQAEELCALCGELIDGSEAPVHAVCLQTCREFSVPIVIGSRELADKEVFQRLSGDRLLEYKQKTGVLESFYCCNQANFPGTVDFSSENLVCNCGLDLSKVPHIPSPDLSKSPTQYYFLSPSCLQAYKTIHQAVQDYVRATADHRVVQCPYCYSPCRARSPASQDCTICEGKFYSCCSCKAPPVSAHGASMHRPDCEAYREEYRQKKCEECGENWCQTPQKLKVPCRFAFGEIHLVR
jgi:hypothetical protein